MDLQLQISSPCVNCDNPDMELDIYIYIYIYI